MTAEPATEPKPLKAPKDRSPSFPFIGLPTAVERLVAFEVKFGRHPAPAKKVGLAWGMKEASSQGQQTLAALKSFGLVEYTGSATERVASLSEDGRNFLRAQQDTVKRQILARAALKPKLIEHYWHDWGSDRPIDAICLDLLVLKGSFTQSAAETFLRVYDSTIGYAGLSVSDKGKAVDEHHDGGDGGQVEVGDLVQVEIAGDLQLPKPSLVRAVTEHEGKSWVFIADSETGIPMENIRVEQKGAEAPPFRGNPPTLPLVNREHENPQDGWKEERLLDDQGGEIFIRYEGDPSVARYEFIRDYLDFKVKRAQTKRS